MTEPANLDSFFANLAAVNPFLDNRINGPAPSDVDVHAVHQSAFARLTELAVEAHTARRALGAVLWGEAGIGKSHVLARLGRWAADGNACFVYLHNLQAAPNSCRAPSSTALLVCSRWAGAISSRPRPCSS